jgi:putative endonuclease
LLFVIIWNVFDMKGSEAERYAEMFLLQRQLVLLQRNYRCRFGEIDLVMLDKETLVFIEVRLRGNSAFGGAAASITPFKQAKLLRTARHYLAGLRTVPPCRFDAILLTGSNGEEVEWIKNAFGE